MNSIIIRNKLQDIFIDCLRFICLVVIIILIVFYKFNPIASFIFGFITLAFMLSSSKLIIEIEPEKISIIKKRLCGILNSNFAIDKLDIKKIEYSPAKTNWLIVPLPGSGGMKVACLIITDKYDKTWNFIISLNEDQYKTIIASWRIKSPNN